MTIEIKIIIIVHYLYVRNNYMERKILVSIIIPVHNRPSLIRDTLFSIQSQTYSYWEAIVIDDNSTDSTIAVVLELSENDKRIKIYKKNRFDQIGANASRNIGLKRSKGKYVIFLDSDDLLSPDCLFNRINAIESMPDLDFVVFQCQLFKKIINDSNVIWNILYKNIDDLDRFLSLDTPWSIVSPIWKRNVFEKIGFFDCNLLSWHDWELHVRALSSGLKYKKIDIVDCYYRQHSFDSIGKNSLSKQYLYSYEYLLQKTNTLLKKNYKLSETRKKLLYGLYFWISSQWVIYDRYKSISVWKNAEGMYTLFSHKIIILYFFFYKIEPMRRFMHYYIHKKYPIVFVKFSSTFRKCSLDEKK